MNEIREKIEDILYNILLEVSDKFGIPDTEETIEKILALLDISKVEVEEECPICTKKGLRSHYGKDCPDCCGVGIITRPLTWEDLKKGGILKVKER